MYSQENIEKADSKARIISLLLLLPMYAGVGVAWSVFNKIVYPICLFFVFLAILYKGKFPKLTGSNNILALFLIYTSVVMIFDFRHGTFSTFEGFNRSKSWEALVTALVGFLVIALRVRPREFLFSVIGGVTIYYVVRVLTVLGIVDLGFKESATWHDIIFSKNAYVFIIYSACLLLYINGRIRLALSLVLFLVVSFQSTRAEIIAFVTTIALYHLHAYVQLKKRGLNGNSYYGLIKFIVIVALTGILLTEIIIGMGDGWRWDEITTGRSVFYSAILSQWLTQGENIFYPSYPGCAGALATDYTNWFYKGQFSESICSHSILIEMMVDYGIILGLFFVLMMVMISKEKGIFATSFFLINMSTQCEFFTAMYFVTYLLLYRYLSMDSASNGREISGIASQ